jgi:sarcosine/dimethylglycine N-methyltransferase
MTNIKSMKLYTNVERVYNELAELGIGDSEPLKVEQLSTFDQLHYHGTGALDKAIHLLDIESSQQLLEVGSGIGGPARYLASKTGANITALELQADQNQVAHQLSQRCGLSGRINHLEGIFLIMTGASNNSMLLSAGLHSTTSQIAKNCSANAISY